ncbi:MAG: nitrate- and nitrite sensing domain-containing protein [Methylococcaceae bacterium]|jgi:methyl-accepting chemotaxis protein
MRTKPITFLSLKARLFLIAAIPTLLLLFFAGTLAIEKIKVANEMSQLQILAEVSVKVGDLIHNLQKERGMSAGFINSGGDKFSTDLVEQRHNTDDAILIFQQALDGLVFEQDQNSFFSLARLANNKLRALESLRQQVSHLDINALSSGENYTQLINALLDLPAQLAKVSHNSQIAQLASSYTSLLRAKENAGLERAYLTMAFSTGHFTPALQKLFLQSYTAQALYIKLFLGSALSQQQDYFNSQLNSPATNEVVRMRNIALENNSDDGFAVDPVYWFKLSTEHINLLKTVEVKLANDLFSTANNLKNSANNITVLLICLTVLTILISVVLNMTLTSGIFLSIKQLRLVSGAIAKGNLDTNINIKHQDELGEVLKDMQTMQNALKHLVFALNDVSNKHAQGLVTEQLDCSTLPGLYGNMAAEINELVQSRIRLNRRIIQIIQQYAKGDFSVDIEDLPGETATITKTMQNIKNALLAMSSEIKAIVNAGVMGDFSRRASAQNFEFVFKDILEDLNLLMHTCEAGFGDVERVVIAVSQGDLTQVIKQDYPGTFGQVKLAVNTTSAKLKQMLGEIKLVSSNINKAANEIAVGNNDLSRRTEEQAASLEQTAASMHELTSTVQHNSENAKNASELAAGASEIAAQGVQVVSQVIKTMGNINESSQKIVDIITVIDGIAFQTNILALNAAVEAARAGDQGRGFAVVAGEVQNLAQRVASAAKEIKLLINSSVTQVEEGSQLVSTTGEKMHEIVNSIMSVTMMMSQIAVASEQQTVGIEQVNMAIGQMDDVTQQNAALVEHAAAASESLERQTQSLSEVIGQFTIDNTVNTNKIVRLA